MFDRFAKLIILLFALCSCLRAESQVSWSVTPGWNLLGNHAGSSAIPIATTSLADPLKVTSVWSWDNGTAKWRYYSPTMGSTELAAYLANEGFLSLSELFPTQGFWVNAKASFVLNSAANPGQALSASSLNLGWNLVGGSGKISASTLSQTLSGPLGTAGKELSSLWAWDKTAATWKFFSPSLELQGGTALTDFISANGYKQFSAELAETEGIWVNIGAKTTTAQSACGTNQSCLSMRPDVNGNLASVGLGATDLSVHAGDTVIFQDLTATDTIMEVGSPSLSGSDLCNSAELPVGSAHAVPAQYPLAASHYAANSLSGPFRTFSAGIYPMSVGTDTCGYVEKTTPCTAPNEIAVDSFANATGATDYLCQVTPYLMKPSSPSVATTTPPTPNPACQRGRVLDSTWADTANQGVFLRLSWKDINPAYGAYDWSALDREMIAAVRNGKTVMVGIEVGGNSIPEWVFSSGDPLTGPAKKVSLRDWGTNADAIPNANCGFEYTVASPSDTAFRTLFKKVLADMGVHIRADQRKFSALSGIKVTGMGMATLENRLPNRCNIAAANPSLGDTGTQGHIVAMSTTNLRQPIFETKYSVSSDPALGRVRDTTLCVCNPQVLAHAGYRPSNLRTFYTEVESTIHQSFGYKQQVFMNISDGFPQIGETGRFLGDHLAPPIASSSVDAAGKVTYLYGSAFTSSASVPSDVPGRNDSTTAILDDARAGLFANGDATAGKAFVVENAALDVAGFTKSPNTGASCSQQAEIAVTGVFAGSPAFPISNTAKVDASGPGCPNVLATKEGITYDKAGGFQIVAGLRTASEMDSALWNMTLNTHSVLFELYESSAWRVRKEAALNTGSYWKSVPDIKGEVGYATNVNATPKSGADWNAVLLARAKVFSENAQHNNLYQANPFSSSYSVNIVSAPGTKRYFFNGRACRAFAQTGTPVRVNAVSILD